MKSILLIGLGRFGLQVAIKLNELHQEVLAVDIDEEKVNNALPFVTEAQIGDSTNPEFLRSLGIKNFDVCIVTISDSFQNSLETTSQLKEMGAQLVVSRAATDIHAKFLLRNGADSIVYPEKQLANWTAICYSSEKIMDYFALDENCAIFEVAVPRSWDGKTITKMDIRHDYNINILAFKDPVTGKLDMRFTGDTVFTAGTTMLVLGEYKDIKACFRI